MSHPLLVKDIHLSTDRYGSQVGFPQELIAVGNTLFFELMA